MAKRVLLLGTSFRIGTLVCLVTFVSSSLVQFSARTASGGRIVSRLRRDLFSWNGLRRAAFSDMSDGQLVRYCSLNGVSRDRLYELARANGISMRDAAGAILYV